MQRPLAGLLFLFLTVSTAAASGPRSQPYQPSWRVIGQSGGWTRTVTVQGHYLYAGIGTRVIVIDISDPASLRETGSSSSLPHNVEDIALSGEYAYVAAGFGGLRVLDISNPARPVEIGSWDSPGFARGVAVSGSFAYVANGPFGLRVIDVSNPAQPREAGSAFVLHNAYKVRLGGQFAYVAAAGAGVLIADISDPAHPAERATARVPGYAYDVAVGDGYAYVAAGWEGLQVLNMTDPTRPTTVGSLALPGWAFGISLANGHAFVADSLKGLRVVDISDARHPTEAGSLEWSSALAYSVALSGDLAFVADARWGIHGINVSNPTQPSRVGFYGAMAHASNVTVSGDIAYVAGGYGGFRIFDVSDLTRPREIGAYGDGKTYYTHIWIEGTIAYVTAILGPDWGLHILDVSDPARPRLIKYFPSSVGQVHDVAVVGNIAYLTGEGELVVLDVSDRSHPIEKYILSLAEGGAFDVPLVVRGTRAYVTFHGLHIIDLSDPLRPVRIGFYNPQRVLEGLAVHENVVYLTSNSLLAVDISDPAKPTETASFRTPGYPTGLVAEGNTLYVAAGNSGVEFFDISNPRLPTLTSSAKTLGHARGLAVRENTVFVADDNGGLVILQRGEPVTTDRPPKRGVGSSPPPIAPAIVLPATPAPHTEAICLVSRTASSGSGTLRDCLEKERPGGTITFDTAVFPPAQPATISLQTALPALIAGGVTIDASDAGVVLDGSRTPPGSTGLVLQSDDNAVHGLQVVGFPGSGIRSSGSRNTIGGDRKVGRGPLGQGNLVSGNRKDGINFTSNDSVVVGNLIGTTLDGRSAWPNDTGLYMEGATNNLIKDNVISGNTYAGIWMTDWAAGFNSFVGNLIGTDATGLAALGNGHGMWLAYLGFNRVGGTDRSERNVISGNAGTGVWVGKGTGNLVLGNYIGVDAHGSTPMLNRDTGVFIMDAARETVVGGATHREKNVIGAQTFSAVSVGTDFNFILGNSIGANACGSGAWGGPGGIQISEASHTIVQNNLIANGAEIGVAIQGGAFNTIRRNAIWGNRRGGIVIDNGNESISAPLITQWSNSSVSGQTCAGCTVEVFSDDHDQSRIFEGTTVALGSGAFRFDKDSNFFGPNITATATDTSGNTSALTEAIHLDAPVRSRRRPVRHPCLASNGG